jgi:uncharacterized protein DUF2505
VRFQADHLFHGSEAAVAELLTDAAFYLSLALPDLSEPKVLENETDGDRATLRLRYEYVGSLDPIAQRLLGSDRLAWIQEVRVDRSAGSGTLRFEAEKDPKRLHGSADFVLTPVDDGVRRRLHGELVVAVVGIGRMAERRIVPGLLRRMDVEALGINQELERRR